MLSLKPRTLVEHPERFANEHRKLISAIRAKADSHLRKHGVDFDAYTHYDGMLGNLKSVKSAFAQFASGKSALPNPFRLTGISDGDFYRTTFGKFHVYFVVDSDYIYLLEIILEADLSDELRARILASLDLLLEG